MSNQKPSLGRIVLYSTTVPERNKMSISRTNHNNINVQERLPAMIVGLPVTENGDVCNLKVFMDGYGEIWVEDCPRGDAPGQWQWPVIAAPVKEEDPVGIKNVVAVPIKVEDVKAADIPPVVDPEPKKEWVKPKSSWGD